MAGNIVEFLQLVSRTPELARDLAELAARYGFEFAHDDLSDAELGAVAGGLSKSPPVGRYPVTAGTDPVKDAQDAMLMAMGNAEAQLGEIASTLENDGMKKGGGGTKESL